MDEPLSRSPPFNNQQEQECEQHIIAMMWLVNGIIIDHVILRTVIKEEDLHAHFTVAELFMDELL